MIKLSGIIKIRSKGYVLIISVLVISLLTMIGFAVLKVAYGFRGRTVQYKTEAAALAAAEAACEKAIFRMCQQPDMLYALHSGAFSETLNFTSATSVYDVSLAAYLMSKPVYAVSAVGHSGTYQRSLKVYVVQAASGWAMGQCRIPMGADSTAKVYFASGEIIDIPVEINNYNDSPDEIDIHISGSPSFIEPVRMSESQFVDGDGSDKYNLVMDTFNDGVYFDQPETRITDEASMQIKIDRFCETTASQFKFTPTATAGVTDPQPAVHLEFFVDDGVGKIRITDNCSVRGFQQDSDSNTWDYKIKSGSGGTEFERYSIYSYHVKDVDAAANGDQQIVRVAETYVSQTTSGQTSAAGGQIYVDGNVIIGSGDATLAMQDVMQGRLTVVATGNIWIADSLTVSDTDPDGQTYARQADGMPALDNPNVLGLVSQGVTKVVDPGASEYAYIDGTPDEPAGFEYVPIARQDTAGATSQRHMPDPMVVEASVMVGGGGWGAENVQRNSYGGRKECDGVTDQLLLRGSITEAHRGIVGMIDTDGFQKSYHMDYRLLTGIVPGNIGLKGKYLPIPGGWIESRKRN